MGGNSQDYYGYSKRSRIQNARDWVTVEINKLNNDFNSLSEQLTKRSIEYQKVNHIILIMLFNVRFSERFVDQQITVKEPGSSKHI